LPPPATVSWQPDPDATATSSLALARFAGEDTIPGYEILGELGRGGMGVVYKAREIALNRVVAVKLLLTGPHAGSAELVRFRTEAESAARLQHPNVVQIHQIGEHRGQPFLALEFCAGGSLARQRAGMPLHVHQACFLVKKLARAVQVAHDHGIVHRDLKPANVLLTEDGTPKIADFGLAKKLDSVQDLTQSGVILGTPSYMAPEQARGKVKDIGPRADVYALGAILYELLTGRPPFRGSTPLETVFQVLSDEPLAPSKLQPELPRDVEVICLKCLRKDPQRRYGSADALADDLQRFLADEPIRARPPGRSERAWRWLRRRPALVLSSAVSAILLICAGSIWFGLRSYADYRAEQLYKELENKTPPRVWVARTVDEKKQMLEKLNELDARLQELGKYSPVLEERLRQKLGIHRDGKGGIRFQKTFELRKPD
jgi:serine/threonine protein kinase